MNRAPPSASPIRIGIVAAAPLFRDGLRRLVELDADMTVEWEHRDAAGLEALIESRPVDLVLMAALEFGAAVSGLQATRAVKARWPKLEVIIISASPDPRLPGNARDAGAAGFLRKDMEPAVLLAGIRDVVFGSRSNRGDRPVVRPVLSRREQQVLVEIQRGMSNREIAATLGISLTTVNKHVHSMLKKLNVRNRTQAAARHAQAQRPDLGSSDQR